MSWKTRVLIKKIKSSNQSNLPTISLSLYYTIPLSHYTTIWCMTIAHYQTGITITSGALSTMPWSCYPIRLSTMILSNPCLSWRHYPTLLSMISLSCLLSSYWWMILNRLTEFGLLLGQCLKFYHGVHVRGTWMRIL